MPEAAAAAQRFLQAVSAGPSASSWVCVCVVLLAAEMDLMPEVTAPVCWNSEGCRGGTEAQLSPAGLGHA